MKQKLFITMGVILGVVMTIQLISCNNQNQDETSNACLKSEYNLQDYASIHNSGLDYIKSDFEKNPELYTKNRLDSVLKEFVVAQYGLEKAARALQEIASIKENFFNGSIPTLRTSRSGEGDDSTEQMNEFAQEALKDCMDKISNHLNNYNEDEIFDNKVLLDELHTIIINTHNLYVKQCNSSIDAEVLTQAFGVLYGSIGYWSDSNNVEAWSKMQMTEVGNDDPMYYPSSDGGNNNGGNNNGNNNGGNGKGGNNKDGKKKEEKEKLSKAEFIRTVAAADGLGTVLGAFAGPMGAGAAGIAASAATAAYFDVE